VLIGIREVSDHEERVITWRKLSEGLKCGDIAESEGNAGEHIGSLGQIIPCVAKDWELVAGRERNTTFFNESDYYVVESGSQVVNSIAQDNPEAWLSKLASDKYQGIGTTIAIAVEANSVRVTLLVNRLNLALQGFKVFVRACDLCAGTAEVQPERQGATLP
jgi:hypothetical protein